MVSVSWQGFTHRNRQVIINEIKDIILRSEGFLINHQMYSDLAINFIIEIDVKYLSELKGKLDKIVPTEGKIPIEEGSNCRLSLTISFAKGSGDLKHIIADVPG